MCPPRPTLSETRDLGLVWQQPQRPSLQDFPSLLLGPGCLHPRRGSEGVPGSGWGNVGFGVGAGGCLSTSLTPLEGQVHPEHQQHHGSGELSHSQAGVLTSLCLSFLNCQFGANTIHPRVVLRMKGDDVLSREDGIWAGRVGGPKSHPTPGI